MPEEFSWLWDGLAGFQTVRGSGAPALLMLLTLPIFWLIRARQSRDFFIVTGLVLLGLVWGVFHAVALLAAALAGYWLVEWTATRAPNPRRAFAIGLVLLHALYFACFLLPPPRIALDVELHPLNLIGIYILFSGIGLQFFRTVSYYHDRVRRGFPRASLRDYLSYQFYFPQLGHGPLERCHDAADKMAKSRLRRTWSDIGWGAGRVAWGVFLALLLGYAYETSKALDRKLPRPVIDYFGGEVPDVNFFHEPERLPPLLFLLLIHLAPFGLYYLESMYAHLALGVGRCFGFKGVEGYYYPFAASKPCDGWHRWNMSLSAWLRDYSFIPLGGARTRRHWATFFTFVYGGLLHGLQMRNVIWGIWTGVTIGFGIALLEWWQGGTRMRRSRLRPGQTLSGRARLKLYAGRLLTYEWAMVCIVIIADPDYYGARVLWRLGEVILMPFQRLSGY